MIFASLKPVGREDLAKVVGEGANLDLLIDNIGAELVDRPMISSPSLVAGSIAPGRLLPTPSTPPT